MGKTGKILIALAVVVVAAGGIFVVMNKRANQTKVDTQQTNNSTDGGDSEEEYTITYDGEKFTPSTLTLSSGEKVTIVNSSDADLKFNSNPHPVHTNNSELNIGEIKAGESATITLTEKGTWGYHNHLSSKQSGTITVE